MKRTFDVISLLTMSPEVALCPPSATWEMTSAFSKSAPPCSLRPQGPGPPLTRTTSTRLPDIETASLLVRSRLEDGD